MGVSFRPEGFSGVTPMFIVDDPAGEIEFMEKAFGAHLDYKMEGPGGHIMHAEVTLFGSKVMLGQAGGEAKPFPANLYLYVEDVDAVYKAAVAAGGTSVQEPTTQFYGDRNAMVTTSNGNVWWISTHVEDVSPEEIDRRIAAM